MRQALKKLKEANKQTKYFILMAILYLIAIVWSTLQAYARLEYSRSDQPETIVIQQPPKIS